jgi:hypothetical protein
MMIIFMQSSLRIALPTSDLQPPEVAHDRRTKHTRSFLFLPTLNTPTLIPKLLLHHALPLR